MIFKYNFLTDLQSLGVQIHYRNWSVLILYFFLFFWKVIGGLKAWVTSCCSSSVMGKWNLKKYLLPLNSVLPQLFFSSLHPSPFLYVWSTSTNCSSHLFPWRQGNPQHGSNLLLPEEGSGAWRLEFQSCPVYFQSPFWQVISDSLFMGLQPKSRDTKGKKNGREVKFFPWFVLCLFCLFLLLKEKVLSDCSDTMGLMDLKCQ